MVLRRNSLVFAVVIGVLIGNVGDFAASAAQLGTAFTYQGRLSDGGLQADGTYDFIFRLFDAEADGAQVGSDVVLNDWPVDHGFFTVQLDFGAGPFGGDARWLEVAVRPGASVAAHTTLVPRQPLTAAPYALYALAGPGGGDGFWAANGTDIYKTNTGDVGIGTTTPGYPLHVVGNASNYAIHAAGTLSVYKALDEDGPGLRVTRRVGTVPLPLNVWTEIDGTHIDAFGTLGDSAVQLNSTSTGNVYLAAAGGDVGIGTTSPGRKLQVGSSTVANSEGMIRLASRSGTQGSNRVWDVGVPETDSDSSRFGYSFVIDDTQLGTDPEFMVKFGSGNVGIGTPTPKGKLHVNGDTYARGHVYLHAYEGDGSSGTAYLQARDTSGTSTVDLQIRAQSAGQVVNVARFRADGITQVNVLEIAGADVAERFPTSEELQPGMVAAIDPANPGKLCVARGAYNRRVAGVVSGAGDLSVGAVLGNLPASQSGPPIALSGRVWVRCDAREHGISAGDLLTTSGTPGHAMKVTEHVKAQGAVLGKAMTELQEGETGLVLVLVTLQ